MKDLEGEKGRQNCCKNNKHTHILTIILMSYKVNILNRYKWYKRYFKLNIVTKIRVIFYGDKEKNT